MVLTKEQIESLKEQLRTQISNLPEEQKSEAIKQIDSMSDGAIESLLEQQKEKQTTQPPEDGNTIFRMIINKEIDSIIVGENSEALAVLDINPISKGHTMIIPKSAVSSPDKISKTSFQLAESLSKKIIENLKAKKTKAHTDTQFGESIIHLIPIYDIPLDLKSPRSKANPEDLLTIAKEIQKEVIKINTKPEIIKSEKLDINSKEKKTNKGPLEIQNNIIKLSRRIP